MVLDNTTQKNVNDWLNGPYDCESKNEIRKLLKEDEKKVIDAFYKPLAFGTGGLRGVMGVGTNRMNVYTVRAATQGLAQYLNLQAEKSPPSVLIGHDSRHNSEFFAQEAAKVLLANGIEVFLYQEMRPVPLVSFGVRHLKCSAGIMITASHNPPEYNGYKVYWADGAQVLPPHDEGIIQEVNKVISPEQVKKVELLEHLLFHKIGTEVDDAYLKAIEKYQQYPQINHDKGALLKIVYTPLHGAGLTLVPKTLNHWGFTNFSLVAAQAIPDGSFPTVKSPNPEEESALQMGIHQLLQEDADLLLGTDPDSDRVGIAIKHKSKAVLLTGNEVASICTHHICKALSKNHKLPPKSALVKTIVTSELIKKIGEDYNAHCLDVLTGFKYIGQLIHEWEQTPNGEQFLFGGEESYGYLRGTHSRDKDAVIMCAIIAEVALQAKLQNKTLLDFLYQLYQDYGIYREKLISLVLPDTKETQDKIKRMMKQLRESPPKAFGGISVVSVEDYLGGVSTHLKTSKKTKLTLPSSDVLRFWLEDGSKLVIRPSGTEPKIKLYGGVQKAFQKDLLLEIKEADQHLDFILQALSDHLKN